MLVNSTIQDRICFVEMQNADHFNCLSTEMCQELTDAVNQAYASQASQSRAAQQVEQNCLRLVGLAL